MKNPFKSARVFYGETVTELKKATWPTKKELQESTVVVLVGIVILGSFITLTDFSLANWVEYITGVVR
ncbi:MAG: preprotein translocase subunit SecE [Opitutae bacterium]|jgi:preprotein translocase subunit SecE|nr:preprotein translocase subunit SecE [Opitutae bacterium]MBG31254.1 preprotein translocase subunit SecE [Opitutae bacterium]|tara:strand:+ start:574 stop:777 length:204 start_codon:yes stop_codon:yes gene_type:complete